MLKKLIKFLREVRLELKKVSWPSRREISGSTGVVIVSVVIVAAYLGVLDAILHPGIDRVRCVHSACLPVDHESRSYSVPQSFSLVPTPLARASS